MAKEEEFDYIKEEQTFLNELNNGKYAIEVLENEGTAREQKEAFDVSAFKSYIKSDDYKSFCAEAVRK